MAFRSAAELSAENAPRVAARLASVGIQTRATIESPNTPLTGRELERAFGIAESTSGISVSAEGALTHPAVYACIRVITEYIGMLEMQVFQRFKDHSGRMGARPAPNHPAWPLLAELPNPEMTAMEVTEALVGHVALRGNAYSHVVRKNSGEVVEIWPLRPDRVWVYRKLGETGEMLPGGDLEYIYTPYAGTPIRFDESEIWHIKGLSIDGLLGYAPVQLQADTIGGGLATEKYGHRFFSNDARPGGVLEHPGIMGDKAYNRLLDAINNAHRGFDNAHKTLILEEGIKWESVGLAPEAAQFLQTREWTLSDMARIFRVPGRLVNDERHPSRLSAEDATAEDVRNMVMPWTRRFALSAKRDILNRPSDKNNFVRFNLDDLQRASLAARTAYYQAGRANGWLSANDVLNAEGMNSIGPDGDHYMVPVNMEPASDIGKPDEGGDDPTKKGPPTTAKGPASNDPSKGSDNNATKAPAEKRSATSAQAQSMTQRNRLRDSHSPLLADTAERIIKRERRDVMAAATRLFKRADGSADFETWLEGFYQEHQAFIAEAMAAPVKSYVRAISGAAADEIGIDVPDLDKFAASYTEAYANRHAAFSRTDIQGALARVMDRSKRDDGDDEEGDAVTAAKLAALDGLFTNMLKNRTAEIGSYEAIRADNATARQTYLAGEVTELTWVGGECQFCAQYDGQTVSIQSNFAEAGQQLHSGDESPDLEISGDIGHPPLHRACNCSIVAASTGGRTAVAAVESREDRELRRATLAFMKREAPAPIVNIDHHTHIEPGAIHSEHHSHIDRGAVMVTPGKVEVNMPKPGGVTVVYDDAGNVGRVVPD